jgi:hypothetical protein
VLQLKFNPAQMKACDDAISKVQSELARAGLLQIFSNGNETKYKFISDPDNPDLDDSTGAETHDESR